MGLRQVVPGVAFAKYIDIVKYPVLDQLCALHYLGGDAAASLVNQAAGFPSASAAGANVVFSPLYATFSGDHTLAANLIQTAEFDNASVDVTRWVLWQHMVDIAGAGARGLYGIFNGTANGSGLYTGNGFIANGAYSSVTCGAAAAPHTQFQFIAMTYAAAGGGLLSAYHGATGSDGVPKVYLSGSATGTRVGNSTTAERIGGAISASTNTGTARIAANGKHRKALTIDQLGLIYFYLRSRYAKLGLTVA